MKTLFCILISLIALSAQAQITSTFDNDADGWTFYNASNVLTTVNHNSSNGNPNGYASVTYASNSNGSYQLWFAPTKFLGSHVAKSLGMNLKLDLQQSQSGAAASGTGDVRIESGGSVIIYNFPTKPALAPAWSSYTIALDETAGWRWNSAGGALATRTQIITVLTNVTSLEVRGTYISNAAYTSGIDNVILEQRTLPTAPSIASFSPTSGEPGTLINITGSAFDPTPANNAVYFGSIAGTVTSASANQLTVTVPIGAETGKITVVNKTTGLTKLSSQSFNPTFKGGGRIIPASFPSRVDMFLAFDQEGFVLADIDGDGWIDLSATNNSSNVVDIYLNLGLGGPITAASFAPKITLTTVGDPTNGAGLQLKDLDGDGKLDIATSVGLQFGTASFATLRNTSTPGNISFEAPEYWKGSSDETPPYLVVDLDGDGRPEMIGGEGSACSCGTARAMWIIQNISSPGNIEFGAPQNYSLLVDGFAGVSASDLDGDDKPELLVSWFFGDRFSIMKNNSTPGNISFTDLGQISTGQYNRSLQAADFNGDGKNDLIWKKTGGSIYIRLNTNTGGALATTNFNTDIILPGDLGANGGMSIADINGDGKPDIAATDDTDIGVYENVFTGGVFDANAFVRAYQFPGGGATSYPTSPLVADLNGDTKPDLVFATTNTNPSRVSILENRNIHTPAISIHTVSPLAGSVGSTVTITGDYFSTVPSENKVWFGGVEATVLTSSANQITAQVPAGAGYERVSVTRNSLTSFYHLPFNVTFSPGTTFDNTSFLPPITFPLTGADYDVEVADLDADGKPEIMAESRIVTGIIRNYGLSYKNVHTSGTITTSSFVLDDTTSTSAQNLKLVDIDSDGKPDVVSIQGIYRNTSTSSEIQYDANTNSATANNFSWADFNLDGKIDIMGTTNGVATVSVFENRSPQPGAFVTGTFATLSAAITTGKPAADGGASAADFDNDGISEFVSTNPTTDDMRIWRNTGSYRISAAQFTVVGDIAAGDNPGRVYAGDLDVDGKMDLMIYHGAGTNATMISVFHNQSTVGTISFNRVDFTLPAAATVAHINDLDGDGKPEIIVTSEATDQFFILKNTSTPGTLNASSFATPFATPVTNPRGITTGDLNLDSKPEIIITSAPNSLLIFENAVPSGPTITISPQPTSTIVCDGATASFTLTATGTTNLTYQWQKFDGSAFNNVNNGGGYSGATTSTFSINTTGNFGSGDYRCLIKGDLAPDKFSNTVSLTVNVVPVAPITTGASNCIAAAITLNASGGTNGQYRWYDVATNGTAISGQVNSAYVTPVINTTTTYFVSINNGLCESNRTAVIAEIKPLDKPLLTSSTQPVSGTINICEDDLLTITAPTGFTSYFWSNGATTNPITILTSVSSLTLQVTDAAGCVSAMSDALNIVVNPYPIATITPNGTQLTASTGDSYQWYQNSDVVAGATDQSFEYNLLEYGLYKVDVTDKGCKSTSEEFEYLITNSENSIDGLKMYPNPIEKTLFVEYHPPYTITIINTNGIIANKLKSDALQTSFDFSFLSAGMYILQLKNDSEIRYKRIMKK